MIFPSITKLSDFVLQYRKTYIELNSGELLLAGVFSDEDLVCACTKFGAFLKSMEPPIVPKLNR